MWALRPVIILHFLLSQAVTDSLWQRHTNSASTSACRVDHCDNDRCTSTKRLTRPARFGYQISATNKKLKRRRQSHLLIINVCSALPCWYHIHVRVGLLLSAVASRLPGEIAAPSVVRALIMTLSEFLQCSVASRWLEVTLMYSHIVLHGRRSRGGGRREGGKSLPQNLE